MSAGGEGRRRPACRSRSRQTIKIGPKTTTGRGGALHDRAGARDRRSIAGHADPRGADGRRSQEVVRRGDALRRERHGADAAAARPRGRRQAEHPRPQRRGAPRLPDPRRRSRGRRGRRRVRSTRRRAEDFATRRRSGSTGSTGSTSNRRINFCVDLSATPYYLARAGEDTNRLFPWVVSDFGLTDAIESGLVKIPQLAHSDPTGEEQAGLLQHLALDHGRADRGRARRQAREPEARGDAASRPSTPIRMLGGLVGRAAQGVGRGRTRTAAAGLHPRLQEHEARRR